MKKKLILVVVVLLALSLILIACQPKEEQTYKLVSMQKVEETLQDGISYNDIKFFYITFSGNNFIVKFAYYIKPTDEAIKEPQIKEIAQQSKFKLSKDKATYTIKDGYFKGDKKIKDGVLETIIAVDDIDYRVIFVVK